jgi:CTP synthase (UTP-ammonia lyase)
MKRKIALFCDVPGGSCHRRAGREDTIYELPSRAPRQGIDEQVCEKPQHLGARAGSAPGQRIVERRQAPEHGAR